MLHKFVYAIALALVALPLTAGAAGVEVDATPQERVVSPVGMNLVAFVPPVTVVQAGDSVTWVNNDPIGASHTVTAILGGEPNSGVMSAGSSYTATFTETGVVPYRCTIHPWMNAVVIVV